MKPRYRVQAKAVPIRAEVVTLNCVTRHDIPVERIIDSAASVSLTSVVILGFTEDGQEYFAASSPDGPEVLWLLERCKRELLNIEPSDLPPMADDPDGQILPFRRPEQRD